MKSFNEWRKNPKTITITCHDQDNELEDLIKYIKSNGNTGHSFSIIVDPDDEREKRFSWDGDGGDYIKDVKVEN